MIKDWLRHLARIYMPVYQYESDQMKIIYAGYSPIKRNYYARLLLTKNYDHHFSGRYLYTKIPYLINSLNIDMVVSEISSRTLNFFQNCNGYILPVWAAMRINIDRPAHEIFDYGKTSFKDVLRRIHKYDLTYEMLSDKESLKYFNDHFYQPYMKSRHGEEAFIEDLYNIWQSSEFPLLMAVKENGVTVGMSLYNKSDSIFYFKRLGLVNGNEEYLHHGVMGAFYYFGILEGQKMGCSYVDLGGTRPFLTDGLTRFKKGLGGEFELDLSPAKEYLWFGVNERSSVARDFLQSNTFMHVNKDFRLVKFKP